MLAAALPILTGSYVYSQSAAFTYQGQLVENGSAANGLYDFQFSLFPNASTKFSVAGPITNSAVAVSNGLFATALDFGEAVFETSELWLRIGVRSNSVGAFEFQAPRQQLTSAPWAIRASTAVQAVLASNVAPGSVTSASLAPQSVQTTHVQAGAIGSTQIASGAVSSSHIASGAVGSTHIAPGAVGSSHIVAGAIGDTHVSPGAIGSTQIASGAIASNHIAVGAVHAVHLAPDAVFTNSGSQYGFVPPGGVILSSSSTPPQAGFTLVGATDSGSGDAWTQGSILNAPGGTFQPAAVWTGSELLIWSGFTGTGNSTNGGRYNPATDTWQPISTVGAPQGRQNPAAVWTGSKMIVWGGKPGGTPTNDGAIYTLASDSWQPMTMNNTPGPIADPAAVWTSSGMLIWGNQVYGLPVTNRAICCSLYNPTTDTWTTRSTNGSPVFRSYYSYVWTGSELIIWGGTLTLQGTEPLNDGARYRLSDNTWRPVSATGAPSPRYGHTAVWTGSRVIIWGGSDATTKFRDGAIYDPSTDSWTPMSTIGAPDIRYQHSAVWNGSKMIVWGGIRKLDDHYSSGGMYDRASNTWLPTPLVAAPLGRYHHDVFWTGSRMIIYSGSSVAGYPAEPQLLDPTKGLLFMYRWQ